MMDNYISERLQKLIYCDQNHLIDDDLGQALDRNAKHGIHDDFTDYILNQRIRKHQIKIARYPETFKSPQLTVGDYTMGFDQQGREIWNFIQSLNAHRLCVAASGSGKSTYAQFTILQIAQHIQNFWIFDLKKREYAKLRPYLKPLGVELTIIDGRSLKINPLQIPIGVEVSNWISLIAETLVDVLELPARASKLISVSLFKLYRQFPGQNAPTLFDLFESVKSDKTSNPQARLAILDSLEPVLLSLGPEVLAYRQGWSTADLAKFALCFEWAGLADTDKNLLLNVLLLSEFSSRNAAGVSNKKMDLFICLDEAGRICTGSNKNSAIANLITLVRGVGLGLDLSLQSIHDLHPAITSNTSAKILGRCGSASDYESAGKCMGLTGDQIQWAKLNLRPGLFIGQLGEGDWRHPFIFTIPPMNLKPLASHEDTSDIGPLNNLKTVAAPEFARWGQDAEIVIKTSPPQVKCFATEQAFKFCQAVINHPMQSSSGYPKLAGISPKLGKSIREQLIAQGYLTEHRLDTGGRGRSSLLLAPSPAGIAAANTHQENQK